MRLVHLFVIGVLLAAAAYVYEIKFEATLQAERLAKLRNDIRRERDALATLRAEWAKLSNPGRIQGLAQRHLALQPLDVIQFDTLDNLPARVPQANLPDVEDPIAAIIGRDPDLPTGSVAPAAGAAR